ncbi:MAG: metal-dependent hydrolase [Candidatus Marinimicrobia bacterium]|nr:metal-dependent hydrolase [Candidatus Neomarinimicrobiota bacterium]
MKGIAHFASGVAAASFFPWAVAAARDGNPVHFILGGLMGLLPDTLDFKFYRFFYKHDVYIEPDPNDPNPQRIAEQIADAVRTAAREHRTVRVKLSTIRLGADYWQQYEVRFDPEANRVRVRFGPAVNTGQVPVPGSAPKEAREGSAALDVSLVQTYDATTRVDIFDGPTFAFEGQTPQRVVLHFLPWHREWTHSFTFGALLAALGGLIWGWRASVVMLCGYAAHLIEDQLGFMGSNLFFPITRKRLSGLHWMRSGDSLPNFLAVWLSCLLIFWNLARRTPEAAIYDFGLAHILFYGGLIPVGVFGLLMHWAKRWRPTEAEAPLEMADEWGDNQVG